MPRDLSASRRFMDITLAGGQNKKRRPVSTSTTPAPETETREGAARPRTRSRKDGGREGACSGRQGFVSLSVGNQVSGPVGRPLSISVLLVAYNALGRARVVISFLSIHPPRPPPPNSPTLSFSRISLSLLAYLWRRRDDVHATERGQRGG